MNKKRDSQRQFYLYCLLPALLWMGVIFFMSAQVAETSNGMSLEVCRVIGKLVVPHFSELSAARQLAFAQGIETIVRKMAHGTEYAILGVLMLRVWNWVRSRLKRSWMMWGYASCVLYAVTDEVHQRFVPGRSCELRDVIIDSAGAACGCLAYLLVSRIRRKRASERVSERSMPTGK